MENKKYKIGLIVLGIVIAYLIVGHVIMVNMIKSQRNELMFSACDSEEIYSDIAVVPYDGHNYSVELVVTGNVGTVWLRSTEGEKINDIRAYSLISSMTTPSSAAVEICRSKEQIENGKAYAGCLATAGTAACVFSSIETGGATVPMCLEVWEYTAATGLADCMAKISEKVAEKFMDSKASSGILAVSAASRGEIKDAISLLIDIACTDVIKHAESEKENGKGTTTKEPNPEPGPRPASTPTPIGPKEHPDNRPDPIDRTKTDKQRGSETHNDAKSDAPRAENKKDPPSSGADKSKESQKHESNDSGGDNTEPHGSFGGGTLGFVQQSNDNATIWASLIIIIFIVVATYFYIFYRRTPRK